MRGCGQGEGSLALFLALLAVAALGFFVYALASRGWAV